MFDIEIAHIPCKENTAADALSRLMGLSTMQSVESETDDTKKAYFADPVAGSKYFTASCKPVYFTCWHSGILWMADMILVPSEKVREVMRIMHENVLHGHCGMLKSYDLVAWKYFHHMKVLVAELIDTCPTCQRVKADRSPSQSFLQPLLLPTRNWLSFSMDLVVVFPDVAYKCGIFNAVLSVTYIATRMVHLITTNTN